MAKGRQYAQQQVHYLRRQISFSDGASAVVTVGTLPAGAIVIDAVVHVSTAFNSGTNNNVNVGTTAAPSAYASALAMTSVGVKALTGLATASTLTTADTDVIATLGLSGTAATAGSAQVIVTFVVNNDK